MKNYNNYKKHLKIIEQETFNTASRTITDYSNLEMIKRYNFIDSELSENEINSFHKLHNQINESIKTLSKSLYEIELEIIGNEDKFKETISVYDNILNLILSKNNYQLKLKKEILIFGDISYHLSNDIINIELKTQRLKIKNNMLSIHMTDQTDIFIDMFKITDSEYSNCQLLNSFSKELNLNKIFFKELVSQIEYFKDFLRLNDKFKWEENKELNLFNIKEEIEVLALEQDLNVPVNKKNKNGRKNERK